jgi:outer membrane protein assembly factor BamC
MTDFRLTKRFAAVLLAGGLVAGCSSPSPDRYDYRSDSKVKEVSLAVPPNLIDETADQRSLPPQGGETSLSTLRQVQSAVPVASTLTVAPPVTGMHIQRDGSESWLVIDNKSPDQVWPQIRAFWQEQGFLLVVDQRDKSVMETDWNETRPQIDQGLIRNSLTKALGNAYVASERNKYRTRLEVAPSGGTYVFISQKGLREVLTGANSDSTKWEPKANDPGLEVEYLNRLMVSLGRAAARAETQNAALPMSGPQFAPAVAASGVSAAAATAAQNVVLSGRASSAAIQDEPDSTAVQSTATELTLSEPYDRAWVRTGMALDRGQLHGGRQRSRPRSVLCALRRSARQFRSRARLLEPGIPRQDGKGGEALCHQRSRRDAESDPHRGHHRRERRDRYVDAGKADHVVDGRPAALTFPPVRDTQPVCGSTGGFFYGPVRLHVFCLGCCRVRQKGERPCSMSYRTGCGR